MSYNVLDIANKLIFQAEDSDEGDFMTNMKLQKMLYYMQGFHLAYFDTPLFDESIEAWQYGPVVPQVYNHYKSHGSLGITCNTSNVISLEPKEEALFNEVYRVYSAYSATGLMNMTHKESPWKTTPVGSGNVISKDKLKAFFKKRLK